MGDAEREDEGQRWTADPFVAVGPLRFGMGPDEVAAVLGGATADYSRRIPWGDTVTGEGRFAELGVRVSYAECARLACVSLDALHGPQILVEGKALVGRIPSEVEQWIMERAEKREPCAELFHMHAADPGSQTLGLVVRARRAGDAVLTRPSSWPRSRSMTPITAFRHRSGPSSSTTGASRHGEWAGSGLKSSSMEIVGSIAEQLAASGDRVCLPLTD